jgi:GntR family transcriptional regulator
VGTLSEPFDPTADGPDYLYVKFARYLAGQIAAGALPPGAMLSCERSLAAEHGISVGTTRRATKLLRDRGLVVTLPGRGTFVIAHPNCVSQWGTTAATSDVRSARQQCSEER